jgi:hypothetical protein
MLSYALVMYKKNYHNIPKQQKFTHFNQNI